MKTKFEQDRDSVVKESRILCTEGNLTIEQGFKFSYECGANYERENAKILIKHLKDNFKNWDIEMDKSALDFIKSYEESV